MRVVEIIGLKTAMIYMVFTGGCKLGCVKTLCWPFTNAASDKGSGSENLSIGALIQSCVLLLKWLFSPLTCYRKLFKRNICHYCVSLPSVCTHVVDAHCTDTVIVLELLRAVVLTLWSISSLLTTSSYNMDRTSL